jgi:hypothetical protein
MGSVLATAIAPRLLTIDCEVFGSGVTIRRFQAVQIRRRQSRALRVQLARRSSQAGQVRRRRAAARSGHTRPIEVDEPHLWHAGRTGRRTNQDVVEVEIRMPCPGVMQPPRRLPDAREHSGTLTCSWRGADPLPKGAGTGHVPGRQPALVTARHQPSHRRTVHLDRRNPLPPQRLGDAQFPKRSGSQAEIRVTENATRETSPPVRPHDNLMVGHVHHPHAATTAREGASRVSRPVARGRAQQGQYRGAQVGTHQEPGAPVSNPLEAGRGNHSESAMRRGTPGTCGRRRLGQ